MRVICIENAVLNKMYCTTEGNLLEVGKTYTVIGEGVNPDTGNECYVLSEVKSTNRIGGFNKSRFIPLSNIDELELVNKKEEVV